MKVRAISKCYYDLEVKMPGEVFVLKPFETEVTEFNEKTKKMESKKIKVSALDQFSVKSMEKVDADEDLVVHQHGAPKGDRVSATKFNPATSDNLKSLEQIKEEHGPRGGKGDDVI